MDFNYFFSFSLSICTMLYKMKLKQLCLMIIIIKLLIFHQIFKTLETFFFLFHSFIMKRCTRKSLTYRVGNIVNIFLNSSNSSMMLMMMMMSVNQINVFNVYSSVRVPSIVSKRRGLMHFIFILNVYTYENNA